MTEIKTLRNYAFWWLLTALISVMFVVLLGWYRRHIHTTDNKLAEWTAPLESITAQLLAQSGSNDDSLIRSAIHEREALISWLDLTPSVSNDLRRYITNLYTVAGAFDAAKAALPQTNDREYLFDRWTIGLLQTNSFLSGDVLALYSWRQTIQDAIYYLSWAAMSTANREKKTMSEHNLRVALASQIGVEVLVCTKSYDALARGWNSISALFSWLQESYVRQIALIAGLTGNSATLQCLTEYRQTLRDNINEMNASMPTVAKLTALSTSRQRAYTTDPLQCPIGIDLYDDIVATRDYEADLTALAAENSLLENIFRTGTLSAIEEACQSAANGSWTHNLQEMLSVLTGDQQQVYPQGTLSGTSNTWSYITLPEATQSIIHDIYQNNMRYIDTMQQAEQDTNYRPLQRLQQLFKEFYGDTKEFIQ